MEYWYFWYIFIKGIDIFDAYLSFHHGGGVSSSFFLCFFTRQCFLIFPLVWFPWLSSSMLTHLRHFLVLLWDFRNGDGVSSFSPHVFFTRWCFLIFPFDFHGHLPRCFLIRINFVDAPDRCLHCREWTTNFSVDTRQKVSKPWSKHRYLFPGINTTT